MSLSKDGQSYRTWTKDELMISTDANLIPIATVNAAFASDDIYWAKPLPEDVMRTTLQNSLCFGLYDTSKSDPANSPNDVNSIGNSENLHFIGLARCITDQTTFLYLTDVYIDPSYQGKSLGKWLVNCVQEIVLEMPYLRRSLLFTGDWKRSVPFYEKLMDMTVMESGVNAEGERTGLAVMQHRGPGATA